MPSYLFPRSSSPRINRKQYCDNRQPCLIPFPIVAGSASPSATLTTASWGMYNLLIILLSLQSTPIFFKMSIEFVQCTLWKAFSSSTKQTKTAWLCSRHLSYNIRNVSINSLVPHPLLNPNFDFPMKWFAFDSTLLVRTLKTLDKNLELHFFQLVSVESYKIYTLAKYPYRLPLLIIECKLPILFLYPFTGITNMHIYTRTHDTLWATA